MSFSKTNIAVAGTSNNDLATFRGFTSLVSKATLTIAQSCRGSLPFSRQVALPTSRRSTGSSQVDSHQKLILHASSMVVNTHQGW
jgi:hypothetical protein